MAPHERHSLRNRNTLRPLLRYNANIAECNEPNSFAEALSGPHASNWMQAIDDELNAHIKNGTWSIVPRPSNKEPIDSRWLFRIQPTKDGKGNRYKARLCARGFRQEFGIDYNETFSPVVRYDSVRIMLVLAAHEDLELLHFDVTTGK